MADWPAGVTSRVLDVTDSTMAEAARAAPGLAGPEWVLALAQTAGKGRRGRPWSMPAGNFAASLTMRPNGAPDQAALRSFVAALALDEALATATGRAQGLALKWPNDVLLNGGKVAGILLESIGSGGRMDHLIIGFGVNLVLAPDPATLEPRAVAPVSVLSETGVALTPQEFLPVLARAFARYEAQFATYGFAPIRTAWLARAARLGQPITARTPLAEITGTFRDVDETGNLIIDTAEGRRRITAADVFF